MNDDLNMNDDITLDFNHSNIDNFLETMLPLNTGSDSDEVFDVQLDTLIDDTIEKLEKILKIEALSDDELAELHRVDAELHEDIDVLDFDATY
jgi:hypothetical protein